LILDERFGIAQRFDHTQPLPSHGCQLLWSPDEQFVIWRNQIGFDHFNNWEGYWIHLESGKKRELSGWSMNEHFEFTGEGGDYLRFGYVFEDGVPNDMGYRQIRGVQLSITPSTTGEPRVIWQTNNAHPVHALSFHADPNHGLFAITIPRRQQERVGLVWHLMDREGTLWRLSASDNTEYVSPHEVVGFVSKGQSIVGYDGNSIFTIPVSDICRSENLVE
jgi:hypothetical protein